MPGLHRSDTAKPVDFEQSLNKIRNQKNTKTKKKQKQIRNSRAKRKRARVKKSRVARKLFSYPMGWFSQQPAMFARVHMFSPLVNP